MTRTPKSPLAPGGPEPPPSDDADADKRRARLAAAVISSVYDMAPETFFRPTRGAAAEAEARQIFYLVCLRMGGQAGNAAAIARLAKAVGRDRATIGHAIQKIEQACEGAPDVDRFVDELADIGKRLERLQAATLDAIADGIAIERESV